MKYRLITQPTALAWPLVPLVATAWLGIAWFSLALPGLFPEIADAWHPPLPLTPLATPAPLRVRLEATGQGELGRVALGDRVLGEGALGLEQLNQSIAAEMGRPGLPLGGPVEVTLTADYELQYRFVVQAVAACSGGVETENGHFIRYVDRVVFTPPTPPRALPSRLP